MNEFLAFIGPFTWGLFVGYFWHPVWQIGKKIYHEAKYAKDHWSKKE